VRGGIRSEGNDLPLATMVEFDGYEGPFFKIPGSFYPWLAYVGTLRVASEEGLLFETTTPPLILYTY
jgi:hypothetical protein